MINPVKGFAQTQQLLAKQEISLPQVVEHFLHEIEQKQELHVFLEVYATEAKEQAKAIQKKIEDGTAGKLAGMVIAVKDNICLKGHSVEASSNILEGFESLYTATALERLLNEDAIVIGRVNCDEFAMGASTENSSKGATKNALDHNRVPGGSSGGSAVAVQAGLCHAALGSDTGGSVRQPAAFTGTVGFRPTYGHVSRYGLLAYASSFDQIGPITQNASDAALIMQIMGGHDENDATSSRKEIDYKKSKSAEKLKIGFITDCIEHEKVDPEIKQQFADLKSSFESEGHHVADVEFPYLDYVVPNYYVLTTAEASSNLSRYAGMLYGHRSAESKDIESTIVKSRSEGFGEEVQRRIMLGTFVLSAGYYDAYYAKAQKVRRMIREYTEELFDKYDYLVLPTAPHIAFEFGKNDDPIAMYLEDIFCTHAALAGIPAVSIPMKPHNSGLPLGLQIMAPAFKDAELLSFSEKVERLFH